MKPITSKQLKVLNWIKKYIKKNQFPPTRAELSKGMEFKSPNAAQEHLVALSKKEYIVLTKGISRGIVVTNKEIELSKKKIVAESK